MLHWCQVRVKSDVFEAVYIARLKALLAPHGLVLDYDRDRRREFWRSSASGSPLSSRSGGRCYEGNWWRPNEWRTALVGGRR
jgi:hypothetical protein